MEINNVLNMDANIMFGIINERLRIECDSIDSLVSRYDLDEHELVNKMAMLGYEYDPLSNQFKAR